MAETWLIALIAAIVIYLVINFLLKTTKFVFKLAIALIIAGLIYYLLR